MRLSRIPLVTGVIFCLASIALLIAARPRSLTERDPIHPITPDMVSEASHLAQMDAPALDRVDTEGHQVNLAALTAKGPVFMVFIMDGCPCSIEAQPFFQRLYDAFADKVSFVGVTDGTLEQGREWKAHFQMTFPLISDPKKDLMYLFDAKHSAYSMLISKGGRIVQLWPGYDQSMLLEIKKAIALSAGIAEPGMTVNDAPVKPTSGCIF